MLQFLQVTKKYGEQQILHIPSLNLNHGIYWLQGVNGSGKTTFLRMIAGLIPFDGDIRYKDISIRNSPRLYRRQLSLAEAEPLYPAFLSGNELISLYQEIRKADQGQIDRLIEFFEIRYCLSNPIGSYSSGMIKRLSLLLAFIGNPSLIMLDEPLATLDAEAVILLPQLIHEYSQERGTFFIFSSHQPFKTDLPLMDKKLLVRDQTVHFIA